MIRGGPCGRDLLQLERRVVLEPPTVAAILGLHNSADLGEYLDALEQLLEAPRRWEAITHDGVLVVPPDEYYLDAMISQYDLAPEVSRRALLGSCRVAALVQDFPQCDVCKSSTARYDAASDGRQGSPWAFLCDECFIGSNRVLGNGVGQYLFTIEELRGPIRAVVDHITRVCAGD